MTTIKCVVLNWDQINKGVNKLINDLKNTKRIFFGVYGPPRGGLIPAVMISHALGIPLLMAPAKKCIVVDDICDSGKTMDTYGRYDNKEVTKVCLFVKKESKDKVDFYFEETDKWIVFPWEQNEGHN